MNTYGCIGTKSFVGGNVAASTGRAPTAAPASASAAARLATSPARPCRIEAPSDLTSRNLYLRIGRCKPLPVREGRATYSGRARSEQRSRLPRSELGGGNDPRAGDVCPRSGRATPSRADPPAGRAAGEAAPCDEATTRSPAFERQA